MSSTDLNKQTDSESSNTDTNENISDNNNNNKENNQQSVSPLTSNIFSQSNNPLEYAYSFWFSKRPSKGSSQALSSQASNTNSSNINYDANLRLVGTFNTVEKFWGLYAHMTRPHDLVGHADIHLFKDGIKPLWEDDANKNGGKWIVRLKKGLANRCWENLILAILGEQFMVGEEICGAVVSVRFQVR